MSRARHREGHEGRAMHDIESRPEPYDAAGSHVEKEADEMHRGGRKKRRHGGRAEHDEIHGHMGKRRLDRPGRKRGGAIGADTHPLTTASKVTNAEGHEAEDGNSEDD